MTGQTADHLPPPHHVLSIHSGKSYGSEVCVGTHWRTCVKSEWWRRVTRLMRMGHPSKMGDISKRSSNMHTLAPPPQKKKECPDSFLVLKNRDFELLLNHTRVKCRNWITINEPVVFMARFWGVQHHYEGIGRGGPWKSSRALMSGFTSGMAIYTVFSTWPSSFMNS